MQVISDCILLSEVAPKLSLFIEVQWSPVKVMFFACSSMIIDFSLLVLIKSMYLRHVFFPVCPNTSRMILFFFIVHDQRLKFCTDLWSLVLRGYPKMYYSVLINQVLQAVQNNIVFSKKMKLSTKTSSQIDCHLAASLMGHKLPQEVNKTKLF